MPVSNKVLAALPPEEQRHIFPHLTPVRLRFRELVYCQGRQIQDIYFLNNGACSVNRVMEDGGAAEIASIGSEGVVGFWVYMGEAASPANVAVQMAVTDAMKMPVAAFLREMNCRGEFYDRVIRYSHEFTARLMQLTACNGLHTVEQRCCRWLLVARSRAGSHMLQMTHEFLADALGVRRPSITLVIGDLQRQGVVVCGRGTIRIVDADRLAQLSCECYSALGGSEVQGSGFRVPASESHLSASSHQLSALSVERELATKN